MVGSALGVDGTKLFFDDLSRSAPFDPASTVPDASLEGESLASSGVRGFGASPAGTAAKLARGYLDKVKDLPLVQRYLRHDERPNSNEWAVGPAYSASGRAMVANDPHLALDTPAVWYPIH